LRDYKLFILDIEEAINKIFDYINGLDFTSFKNDPKTYDSVLHNILIIGEAANKIPREVQLKYPAIDWAGIIGMRNIIVHGYFSIDVDIVWKTVTESLPELLEKIKRIQ